MRSTDGGPVGPSAALLPPGSAGAWRDLHTALADRGPAVCEGADSELWWSKDDAAALDGCGRCPVRRECLAFALAAGEREGTWGGVSADDRKAMQ